MSKTFASLTTKTTPAAGDYVPINDVSAAADKKTTVGGFAAALSILPTNLDSAAPSSWPLQTYTPAWTASTTNPAIGNGTMTGSYTQNGKLLTAVVEIVFGSTTSVGNGYYFFSLPVASKTKRFAGSGWALRTGSTFYMGATANIDQNGVVQTTKMVLMLVSGPITHATAAWGAGDILTLQFTYEVT